MVDCEVRSSSCRRRAAGVHPRCEDESDSRRAHLDELSDRSLRHLHTQFIAGVKTSQTVDVLTSTNCLTVHCVTYTHSSSQV